jgi:hypothetical protein
MRGKSGGNQSSQQLPQISHTALKKKKSDKQLLESIGCLELKQKQMVTLPRKPTEGSGKPQKAGCNLESTHIVPNHQLLGASPEPTFYSTKKRLLSLADQLSCLHLGQAQQRAGQLGKGPGSMCFLFPAL